MIPWAKFEGREVLYTDIVYNISPSILANNVDPHNSVRFFAEGHMLYNADERRFALSQLDHGAKYEFERYHVNDIDRCLNTLTRYIDNHEPYFSSPIQSPTDFGDEGGLVGLTSLVDPDHDTMTDSLSREQLSLELPNVIAKSPSSSQHSIPSPSSPTNHIAISALLNHPPSTSHHVTDTDLAYALAKHAIPTQIAISNTTSAGGDSCLTVATTVATSTSNTHLEMNLQAYFAGAEDGTIPTPKAFLGTTNANERSSRPPFALNRALKMPRMRRSSRTRATKCPFATNSEIMTAMTEARGSRIDAPVTSIKRDMDEMMRADQQEEDDRRTMKKMKAEAAMVRERQRERQWRAMGAGFHGLGVTLEEGTWWEGGKELKQGEERKLWPQR